MFPQYLSTYRQAKPSALTTLIGKERDKNSLEIFWRDPDALILNANKLHCVSLE
jgi:hypothetical protein